MNCDCHKWDCGYFEHEQINSFLKIVPSNLPWLSNLNITMASPLNHHISFLVFDFDLIHLFVKCLLAFYEAIPTHCVITQINIVACSHLPLLRNRPYFFIWFCFRLFTYKPYQTNHAFYSIQFFPHVTISRIFNIFEVTVK